MLVGNEVKKMSEMKSPACDFVGFVCLLGKKWNLTGFFVKNDLLWKKLTSTNSRRIPSLYHHHPGFTKRVANSLKTR